MTILQGEYYIVEGLSDFMDTLDVSTAEAIEATGTGEHIVECHNDIAGEDISDPTEANPDLIHTVLSDSTVHTVSDVLDERDTDYTHIYDPPIHRIVEVHPQPANAE